MQQHDGTERILEELEEVSSGPLVPGWAAELVSRGVVASGILDRLEPLISAADGAGMESAAAYLKRARVALDHTRRASLRWTDGDPEPA